MVFGDGVSRGTVDEETLNPLEGNLIGSDARWNDSEPTFQDFDLKPDGTLPALEIEGFELGAEWEAKGPVKRRIKILVLAVLCAAVSIVVILVVVFGQSSARVTSASAATDHGGSAAAPLTSVPVQTQEFEPALEPAPATAAPTGQNPAKPRQPTSTSGTDYAPAAEPTGSGLEPLAAPETSQPLEPAAEPAGASPAPPTPEGALCRDLNTECEGLIRAFGCERSLMPVVQGTGGDICPYTCNTCQSTTSPSPSLLPPAPPPKAPPPPQSSQNQCQQGYEPDDGGGCRAVVCQRGEAIEHSDGNTECSGSFGDSCPYSCEAGFQPAGHHICGADGTFSGGTCEPRTCTTDLEIPHSNRVGNNRCTGVVGQGCSYICDDGYYGPEGRTHFETICDSSGSFGLGVCRPVQCGHTVSGLDEHATASCVGRTWYAGDPCLATCNEGFRGGEVAATYICGIDGEWTPRAAQPALVCTPGSCASNISSIEHSQTICNGVTGDRCDFMCEEGYVASGIHVCREDGHFSGGSCQPLPCDQGTFVPHSNRDKRHDNACQGNTGDRCAYTCNDGFAPVGEMVCGADGLFRGGSCVPMMCNAIGEMINAQTDCEAAEAHLGDQCTARCQPGFFPRDEERTYECLEDGWSREPLVCSDINECRDARNATVLHQCHPHEPCINTVGGFTCGDCEAGYHGDGSGGCIVNNCTGGATIPNSDRTSSSPCTGVFGERCIFHCNAGYVRGPSEHICGAHQHFDGGMCIADACTRGLTILHSNRDDVHPCTGVTGETCEYTCVDGFVAVGNHTCSVGGTFTGGACVAIDCGSAISDLPDHSRAICTGSTRYRGDSCLATCDEGYRADPLSTAASFECAASGLWVGQAQLNCEPEACEPTRFTHAVDECTGHTGDVCAFQCAAGFTPDGPSTCGAGNHFGLQSCVPNSCTDSFISHSNRQRGNPCSGQTGFICDYHCDDGYQKSGDHVCGTDASFSGGSCTAVVCPPFEPPLHSQVQCNGPHDGPNGQLLMGATCSAQCLGGFSGNGSGVFMCNVDGEWSQPANTNVLLCSDIDECQDPTVCGKTQVCTNSQGSFTCGSCPEGTRIGAPGSCVPIQCRESVLIPNADTESVDECFAEFGAACEFRCIQGFSPGSEPHICQANGEFSGGTCIANECTRGGTVANSNRHSSRPCTGSTGQLCDYDCYGGYTGSGQLICQPDGQWSGGECVRETCTPLSQSGAVHFNVQACSDGTAVEPHLVGTICTLECLPGFRAGHEREGIFSCGNNGEWAGDLACIAEACVPSSLDHTTDVCEGAMGDVCTFHCDEGYTPVDRPHTCNVDHQFSGGRCLPAICSAGLTIPNSDRTAGNPCVGVTGMQCLFECNHGYVAVGSHVCSTTGQFNGGSCVESRSECDPIGTLFRTEHHVAKMSCHTAIGSQCLVMCEPGYERRGTGAFECEEGGQWSGSLRCERTEPEPEMEQGIEPDPEPEPEPQLEPTVCSNRGGDGNCETYISLGQTCEGTFCPHCGVASGLCDKMCAYCVSPPPPPPSCSPDGAISPQAALDYVDISGASCTTTPLRDGSIAVGTSCTASCLAGYFGVPGEIMCGNDEQWHGSVHCAPACPDINTLFVDTDHVLRTTCDTSPGTACTAECDSFSGYVADTGTSGTYLCDDFGEWQGSLLCQAVDVVPTPEPSDEEVGEEFDPSECFGGEYSEARCCDLRNGPTGDTSCWADPPFTFEECCVNYLDRLGCINRASDAQCALWLAGGAGNPVFSCALNFCPDCDQAGLCDVTCGYCTPENVASTVELACMDTSTECEYQPATLGCDLYEEGGVLEHMCDASCHFCQQGDSTCFDTDFPYERCCNTLLGPEGDTSCWSGDFTFARCCSVEAPTPPPLATGCTNTLDSMFMAGYCDQLISSGQDEHTCDVAFCPSCDNAHACDLTCNFCGESGTTDVAVALPPPTPPPTHEEPAPCVDLNVHCTELISSFGCSESLEPVLPGNGAEMCPRTCHSCGQVGVLTPTPPPPPAAPTQCSPITQQLTEDDHMISLTACDTTIGARCMVGCDMRNGYRSTGAPGVQFVCGPDGQWSGSLTCTGPPPPAPVVGCSPIADHFTAYDHVMVRTCDTSPGASCMVSCDIVDGYHATTGRPGEQFVCGVDGEWSGTLSCVRAPAPQPTQCSPISEYFGPDDHVLALRACDTAIGAQCMVGCDISSGYRSTGLPGVQFVCGSDGQWSGSLTCVGPSGG